MRFDAVPLEELGFVSEEVVVAAVVEAAPSSWDGEAVVLPFFDFFFFF